MIEEKKEVDVICKNAVELIRNARPIDDGDYVLGTAGGRIFLDSSRTTRPGGCTLIRLSGREINKKLTKTKRYELLIQLIALQIRDEL